MQVSYETALTTLTAPGQMFEIGHSDVNGVSLRIYRCAPPTLKAVFNALAPTDRDALVYLEERYTYRELKRVSAKAASALAALGLAKSSRVAVAMRNLPEYVFLFWACQQLGVVLVSLNAWWTRAELERALPDCQPQLLVVDGERYDRLHSDRPSSSTLRMVVVRPGRLEVPAELTWSSFLDLGSDEPVESNVAQDDPSTMLYTSGTTGIPKAAISSHRNHCTTLMNTYFMGAVAQAMSGVTAQTGSSAPAAVASLLPFPMFHIGGLSAIYINAAIGAKLVLMYKWNADVAAQLIERERVTSIALAPVMLRQLLDAPDFEKSDISSVMGFATGAAPVPPELARRAAERFGPGVVATIGYGLTEATSGVCVNTGWNYAQRPDSVGRPFPVIDVRIVDERGGDVPQGQPGELWVRGANVVSGYWSQPAATAQSFPGDGWFQTGDIARQDVEGFIYIVDRIKDMIIRGGENIYCVEVEGVLSDHPGVSDVAVVGLPDPVMGEKVVAVVVPREGQGCDEASLISFARERLAYFKLPSRVVFQSERLERTITGKLLKSAIRKSIED